MRYLVAVGMAKTVHRSRTPPEAASGGTVVEPDGTGRQIPVSGDELLELLGDEYTSRILETIVEQPRTGREIVDAADVSKATAYRRLERLEGAGIVGSTMKVDEDGHHCKRFHASVQSIRVGFGEDGLTVHAEPSDR